MKELPLDCCDNRVANEGDSYLSLFIEGTDGAFKVEGIRFTAFHSCRVGQRGFGWYFFFCCDDFPCIHRIEYGLHVDPPFNVVCGVQFFKRSQTGDVVV